MSYKKCTQTPAYQWEQALLDAYHDYRWWQTLEPLYQKFQLWKAGELDHLVMDEAWFQAWVKDNPPPAGYKLG